MIVVRNKRGEVFVIRYGDSLSIYASEPAGTYPHGVISRNPGDSRKELLARLGSKVCERLQLS